MNKDTQGNIMVMQLGERSKYDGSELCLGLTPSHQYPCATEILTINRSLALLIQ